MSNAAAQRRARQTVINLALSLLATLGVVIALVLMVPRDDSNRIAHIDYVSVAKEAAASSKEVIVTPDLPEGWWSNKATWHAVSSDAVPTFEAGFVSPTNQYVGLVEAFGANPTWLALKLQGTKLTSALPYGYRTWDIYRSETIHNPAKSMDYIMVMKVNADDCVLLYGTAGEQEFEAFAKSIDAKLKEAKPIE